ncbi:MAG: hypothetical protein MI864_00215 [Pseudomonadales bacterium]|nr:hypothetical protein [Pseudomonadales bacterium]
MIIDISQMIHDRRKEEGIKQLLQRLDAAPTRAARMVIWEMLRDEINSRSADQVERMETEKGLR